MRFTPTCVGSTVYRAIVLLFLAGSPPHVWGVRWGVYTTSRKDYGSPPHVWGVLPNIVTKKEYLNGSPPHVWGVRISRWTRCCVSSGSPPHVWGVRRRACVPCRRSAVHPHMCGEYMRSFMRDEGESRFTPTCVGSTRYGYYVGVSRVGSPPHVWGVLLFVRFAKWFFSGSPPHVWGVPPRTRRSRRRRTVHPHMCGEYTSINPLTVLFLLNSIRLCL